MSQPSAKYQEIVSSDEASLAAIEAYDFKLSNWLDFEEAADRSDGLLERAMQVTADRPEDRCWVVYDPLDDEDGWLLVGERDKILRETVDNIVGMAPDFGPLSVEELA